MRVIAGQLRGRRLRTAAGSATRPTSERARRGLFDWLGGRVEQARILDLFAGSGALGIEALSRGGAFAVFVERGRAARSALEQNLADLELGDVSEVRADDALRAVQRLAASEARFELVLADPPWGAAADATDRGRGRPLRRALADAGALLAPRGVLMVERRAGDPPEELPGLARTDQRAYGTTRFDRYQRPEESR